MEHAVAVARRSAKLGDEFEPYYFGPAGKAENATLIRFGTFRILKSGPNKGEKSFRGCATREVVVTEGEIAAELNTYEVTSGHCGDCFGKGKVSGGHSIYDGTRWVTCGRCAGSGKAPHEVSSAK